MTMFKTLNIFRATGLPDINALEYALCTNEFAPCSPSQDKSCGWIEPRGEDNGALVESIGGQWLLKFAVETKSVPGAIVREKADAEAKAIEQTTGRKPGKKETKQLREDALLALLPQAFPKRSAVLVWIDPIRGVIYTDSASAPKDDAVITALVQAMPNLQMRYVQPVLSPQTAMTGWLTQDAEYWPEGFNVERACELKSADEEKSVVKFNRHNVNTDEIRKHIAEGKLPVNLAMSFDGRVGFTLTDNLRLKKIAFLDGVVRDEGDADSFDADFTLATGELSRFVPSLLIALGGEVPVADDGLFGSED